LIQLGSCMYRSQISLTSRIAASDTVAVSLTYTIYHLLANPKVWERLRQEIHSNFRTAEEMTGQGLARLPYLDAVIHEGTLVYVFI
jgi:cytochrome P450